MVRGGAACRIPGLVRVFTVPWKGREEDRTDASVWALTCLFVRAGHRRQGVSGVLARAAVEHARKQGARALEAPRTRAGPDPSPVYVVLGGP